MDKYSLGIIVQLTLRRVFSTTKYGIDYSVAMFKTTNIYISSQKIGSISSHYLPPISINLKKEFANFYSLIHL